jgi:putative spermidine/putrescine transport system permease protein
MRRQAMRRIALLLVVPALAVNLVTFLWPMLNLAGLAFRAALPGGGIGDTVTLDTWRDVLGDGYYAGLVVNSVATALLITALSLLAGYPIALFVHRASPRWRNLLTVACISPLLVSAVVRTYGWMVLLGDRGLLPNLLRSLGWARPPRLVFNLTGVVIGLTEIMMPYMILSLLAGFGRLNPALEEAAASLGARPFTVFRRVILPLTVPGIMLGCLLAFVLSVSSFITPSLLGGGRVPLLATEIYDQAIVSLNWPVAAVLSIVVLCVFGLALLLFGRRARVEA